MRKLKFNAVFEGGGMKGIGLVGALARFEKRTLNKEAGDRTFRSVDEMLKNLHGKKRR